MKADDRGGEQLGLGLLQEVRGVSITHTSFFFRKTPHRLRRKVRRGRQHNILLAPEVSSDCDVRPRLSFHIISRLALIDRRPKLPPTLAGDSAELTEHK